MKLLFATTNPGKLAELRGLLEGAVEVVSPADLPVPVGEVDEDQPTFELNAEKKARAFADASGLLSLADDSGLCVDALQGRPGVHSARYAADDASRIARLLGELHAVPPGKRTARFVCALALAAPGKAARLEVGTCEGAIIGAPRGAHGFGYDPVFEVTGLGKTLAELTREQKALVSHRGRAMRHMLQHLQAAALEASR